MGFERLVQIRVCRVERAQMHARRYGFERQGRLPAQPHPDRHLARIILATKLQVPGGLIAPRQFLSDEPLGFGFGRFPAQFPGVVVPKFILHSP